MPCHASIISPFRWFRHRRGTGRAVVASGPMRAHTPTTPARLHPRLTWAAMGTGGRGARGAQPGSPHLVLLPVFPRQRAVPRDQHTASGPCVSSLHAPHTPPLAARRSGVAAAPGGCASSPRDSCTVAAAGTGVPPLLASLPMALTLARVAAVPALVAGACLESGLYPRSESQDLSGALTDLFSLALSAQPAGCLGAGRLLHPLRCRQRHGLAGRVPRKKGVCRQTTNRGS